MKLIELTQVDGASARKVYLNPAAVAWVQEAPQPTAVPQNVDASARGRAVIHLLGQVNHLVLTVAEDAREVIAALEQAQAAGRAAAGAAG